jgi:hypothetical protein
MRIVGIQNAAARAGGLFVLAGLINLAGNTRLRTHYVSQNAMVAAMQMAEKKVCARRS